MLRALLQVRVSSVLLLSAAIIVATAATGGAQMRRPQSQFHVGQKVQFDHFGKIWNGVVVSIRGNGWVEVRFTDNGQERTWDYAPDQVWLPKNASTASGKKKQPMRTWTDSSGTYKIEARYVELTDGKLTLEKEDGTTKIMPLDKLSEDDQQVAKKAAAATPPKNPFEGDDNSATAGDGQEGVPSKNSSEAETLNDENTVAPNGNWSGVRNIVVDSSAQGDFVPDAAAPMSVDRMRSLMLDLNKAGADRDFRQEKLVGFFLDRPRERMIVASSNNDLRGGRRGPRLESCDLKSAKSLGAVVLDTGINPCDLSPDGASVVCVPTQLVSAFHKQRGIEVWRLGKEATLVKRWNPNDTREGDMGMPADRAKFISDDMLVTINTGHGDVTAWEFEKARAVYNLPIDQLSRPGFSANRKQMAVCCNGFICILDSVTGRTLQILSSNGAKLKVARKGELARDRAAVRFAFRSDGLRLAALNSNYLQVWDLEKKALVQEVWLSSSDSAAPELLEWVGDKHLLINGADLVDITNGIVLWHYEVPGQDKSVECVMNNNLAFGYADAETGRGRIAMRAGVFFLPLPHPEALQAAFGLSDDKLMVLTTGSQVAINLQVPENSADLTASYSKQLEAKGITVAPNAPLTFQASVVDGKTETRAYRRFGHPGIETVNVTPQTCRMVLSENGKEIWKKSMQMGGAGMIITEKEGETLQATVDRLKRESAMRFFNNIILPGRVARPGEHGAYGFSKVTPMGAISYDPASEPEKHPTGK